MLFFCKESNSNWIAFFQFEASNPLRASIYVVGFEFEKLWSNNAWGWLLILRVNFPWIVFMNCLSFLLTLCVRLGFGFKWLLSCAINIPSIDWTSLWSSLLLNLENSLVILRFGLSTWLLGDGKSSKLINDSVESIGVIWLGDEFMGWIGEGKLGILIELIGLGRYVKLLRKFWSKRRSCIWLTGSTCISLCGEKIGISSKVTSFEFFIFFVDLTWSLYALDCSMYPRKMHSWNGILICA